jgi:hypothetical protein
MYMRIVLKVTKELFSLVARNSSVAVEVTKFGIRQLLYQLLKCCTGWHSKWSHS